MAELLFTGGDLGATLNATLQAALNDVDGWDEDQLLGQSEGGIVGYLVEKHSVRCPTLDEPWIEPPADTKQQIGGRDIIAMYGRAVEVNVARVVVHVPYDGERVFFSLKPNTFTFNPPRANVLAEELTFVYEDPTFDADRLRQRIEGDLQAIRQWLTWSSSMAEQHNRQLPEAVQRAVSDRKARILTNRSMASSLGLPIRQRGDAPSPPLKRRTLRAEPRRPAPAPATFVAEPAMDKADFEEAVRLIKAAGVQMERSPTTTRRQSEEERRDWILVTLNSQFEGLTGGEVFNGAGKTDILIRVGDRNVFIGECKIWRGPKQFAAAIDQLLSYLVWRDTKAALVLFIEARDATAVIDKAEQALLSHERSRGKRLDSDGRKDFTFVADADMSRDIHLALLPIVIRPDDPVPS